MELAVRDEGLLEKYFLREFPGRIMDEEAYHLLLLVMGVKPGALVMSADKPQRELLEKFCRDSGLEMKVVEGEDRSFIDRLLGRDSIMFRDSIYIAREEERFDILERSDGKFNGFTEDAVGKFLGYPDQAVEFYRGEDVPARRFEEFIGEDVEESQEITDEELEYLKLLGYLPRPEIDNIRRAISKGESREKKLLELDEELNSDLGHRYLEKMKDKPIQD
jgi:hypothetical protein